MINRKFGLSFIFNSVILWSALEIIFVILGVNPQAFPLFTVFVIITVFLPGYQLLSWLKLKTTTFNQFALAWVIGYPLSTSVYFICRYWQIEWAFGVFIFGVLISFVLFSVKDFKLPGFNWQSEDFFHPSLFTLFLITLFACGWVSFKNGLMTANGFMVLSTLNSKDFLFHFTLVNELSHFFSPQIPFAPNHQLIYHYFPDLFAALFKRWLSLSTWDLMSRFLPLFYFSSLFLSLVLLVKEIARKRSTILLALVLVVFGCNLSFLADFLRVINPKFAAGFSFLPTFQILHINPLISALAIFFSGCYTLIQYQKSNRKSWLVVSCFLFLIIAVYKIFVVVLIIGGLVFVFLAEWKKTRKAPYPLLTILLPIMLFAFFIINLSPAKKGSLEFKPGYLIESNLPESGFFGYSLPGYQSFSEIASKKGSWFLIRTLGLGGIVWLLGSIGSRLVGLIFTVNYLNRSTENWALSLLCWMCWLGIILALFFVTPPLNFNINQFLMISLYIAALFTALSTETLKSVRSRLFVTSIVVILAVPTSFVTLARRPLNHFPPYVLQAASFINRNTEVDAIIATPLKNPVYGVIMTLSQRRSMYLNSYHIQAIIGVKPVMRLERDSKLLYQSDNVELLKELIKRYNVSYVISDSKEKVSLPPQYLKTIYRDGQFTFSRIKLIS